MHHYFLRIKFVCWHTSLLLLLQIDKFLDCERIVLSIVQKVNARLKFLYRHANVLNTQSRITITSAIIQCHFDYSCSSWFGGIRKTLKQKLQVAQNKV